MSATTWIALAIAFASLGCGSDVDIGATDAGERSNDSGGESPAGDAGSDAAADASTGPTLAPSPLGCDADAWAAGWSPDPASPVLTIQRDWETYGIHPSSVRRDGDRWMMTYVGVQAVGCTSGGIALTRLIGRLGAATSEDGREWVRFSPAPVFDLFDDCVEGRTLSSGSVHPPGHGVGATWELWHAADEAIYVARSDTGRGWPDISDEPVLAPGAEGSFDDVAVGAPRLFRQPGAPWRMVYAATGGGELQRRSLAVAELEEGRWRRIGDGGFVGGAAYEPPPEGDGGPVVFVPDAGMDAGMDAGSPDAGTTAPPEMDGWWAARDPSVLAYSDCVVVAFTRQRTPRVDLTPSAIGIATSPDGSTWTVADSAALTPRAHTDGDSDFPQLSHPVLFAGSERAWMLYRGTAEWPDAPGGIAIGVASKELP